MNKSDACPEIHQRATGILKAFLWEKVLHSVMDSTKPLKRL